MELTGTSTARHIDKPSAQDVYDGWTLSGWYFRTRDRLLHGPYTTRQYCEEQERWYRRRENS